MTPASDRRRGIRALALAICALSLLLVAVSAYLRLDAAGLGCSAWPACYGRVLAGEPLPLQFGLPRLLHRLSASAALVLSALLVWRCLRPQPVQPAARYALLLLLLMLALAALGFVSADPRRALIGFLNIVGGLGLVTFSWRVVMAAGPPPAIRRNAGTVPGLLLRVGVAALSVTVLLGAWLGATYSAVACPSAPDCAGVWWPAADSWGTLNPLRRLNAAPMPGDAGGVALHLLHRALALLTLLALGVAVAWPGAGAKPAAARAVALLLATVFCLGLAAVLGGLNLWLVMGHGVGAALLLAAVAALMRR